MITRTGQQIELEREKILRSLPLLVRNTPEGEDLHAALLAVINLLGRDTPDERLLPSCPRPFTRRLVSAAMEWLQGDDKQQISRVLWLMTPAQPSKHMTDTLSADEIVAIKRERSLRKFGEQNHRDGTVASPWGLLQCQAATRGCESATAAGNVTWFDILNEEFTEAACEVDEERLVGELADVASVAVLWIEAIQRRRAARSEDAFVKTPKQGGES